MRILKAKKFKEGLTEEHTGIKILRKDPRTLVISSEKEPDGVLGVIHSEVFEIDERFISVLIDELYSLRSRDSMIQDTGAVFQELREQRIRQEIADEVRDH